MLFVPRKDEAFSSINKILTELRTSNSSPGPARDDRLLFFGFVLVVVISSNDNDDILLYMNNKVRNKTISVVVKESVLKYVDDTMSTPALHAYIYVINHDSLRS